MTPSTRLTAHSRDWPTRSAHEGGAAHESQNDPEDCAVVGEEAEYGLDYAQGQPATVAARGFN